MKTRTVILAAIVVSLLLGGVALRQAQDVALAQSGGQDLTRWTVDSGGATFSSGGGYDLGGTIGQPDAGVMSGGDYILAGGFWPGVGVGISAPMPGQKPPARM